MQICRKPCSLALKSFLWRGRLMTRSAIWCVFGVLAIAGAYGGCTQDFNQFQTGGGGGGGAGPTTTGSNTGGSGGSGGCQKAADCDDSEPCTTDTCEKGKCRNEPAHEGEPAPGKPDTQGDCVRVVCRSGVS